MRGTLPSKSWVGVPVRFSLVFVSIGVFTAPSALACDGNPSCEHHQAADASTPSATHANPSACARAASLVGSNCSYTTATMARRVLADGSPWAYTGRLKTSDNELSTHVAAPFTVGPEKVNVVANEVLEQLSTNAAADKRVELEGKMLEVDGVKYFVVTTYRNAST